MRLSNLVNPTPALPLLGRLVDSEQRDLIGRFSNIIGDKFSYKSSPNVSKGCFNVVVLRALTQQCGSIPVRFDTLESNLNKLYYASAKCLLQ